MEYTLTYNHQSQFVEMFGSIDDNKYNLPIKKIGDFATCFAGATPSTSNPEYWDNGTIRWMSSGEVHKVHIEDAENRITELGYKSASTKMVPIHSIVIALAGQGKTRGTVAITEVDLCTNQSLCAIVPNDQVNYIYLYQNLHGRYSEIRGLSGDVNGRGGLNLKIIQQIPVIIPPMEKQEEFASIVRQADKSKFDGFKSQFIEMFGCEDNEYNGQELYSFDEIFYDDTKSATKIPSSEYHNTGKYPIYDQSVDSNIAGYNDDADHVCKDIPVILFGDHSRVFKYIDKPFYIGADGVKIIRWKMPLDGTFLFYMLQFSKIPNTGYNRHFKWLKLKHFPFPPMNKQEEFAAIARQADKSKYYVQNKLNYICHILTKQIQLKRCS